MNTYSEKVESFLSSKNVAVAGISRNPKTETGNAIYNKLKSAGYNVYPINPNADNIEGDKCYHDLKSVPEKIEAVMISTNPNTAVSVAKECKELGIEKVWFHKTIGKGSYSNDAVNFFFFFWITAIESGCPMMHIKPVDFPHKCIHFTLKLFGKLSS